MEGLGFMDWGRRDYGDGSLVRRGHPGPFEPQSNVLFKVVWKAWAMLGKSWKNRGRLQKRAFEEPCVVTLEHSTVIWRSASRVLRSAT